MQADPPARRWAPRPSTTPRGSASRCLRGSTSSCGRPRRQTLRDFDVAALEQRLAERHQVVGRRLRGRDDRAVRRGARRPARSLYANAFPEAYKEDFSSARRRGRRAADRGAGRRSRSPCRCTSRSTPARARRASRCSARARRCRCPTSCPCCRPWASRWSTSGRTSSSRRPQPRMDLRLRPAPQQAPARGLARALPGRVRRGVARTPPSTTGSLRSCSTPGCRGARSRSCALTRSTSGRAVRPFSQDYIEAAPRRQRPDRAAARRSVRGALRPGACTAATRRRASATCAWQRSRARSPRPSTTSRASTRTASCAATCSPSRRRCGRTSTSRRRAAGRSTTSSLKLEPKLVPDLPEPRPAFEIFVYSPRVEGVHLRFGPVARGGLRWSDRREDFRTEMLGLVKAQMVKNAVIVPVGAKGGFYCKRLPDPAVDRDAWLAEGIACYTTFISGLLDVTDNLVQGEIGAAARRRAARLRRLLPRRRGGQGDRDVLRHRQRRGEGVRLLARRRVRVGRLGRLRPQGHGHHRSGRMGVGAPSLPRARDRLPDRGLHLRRRRRHERRRLRQRDAAERAHPAGRRVRPPRHLPRPEPRCGHVVRRAAPALRTAPVELGRLRQVARLRGRGRLLPRA